MTGKPRDEVFFFMSDHDSRKTFCFDEKRGGADATLNLTVSCSLDLKSFLTSNPQKAIEGQRR